MIYQYMPSGITDKKSKFFVIEFSQTVTRAVERDLYGSRNMFAEIGGFVGIFLGFSLLDLVDALMAILQKSVGESIQPNRKL